LPLTLEPKFFPVPPTAAATTILAVLDRHGTGAALDVAGDCLRAIWSQERDISATTTLSEILAARQFDAAALLAHAASDTITRHYETDTQMAIERGVFGAPTYVYRGEMFWGQDRLDFLDRALAQ